MVKALGDKVSSTGGKASGRRDCAEALMVANKKNRANTMARRPAAKGNAILMTFILKGFIVVSCGM
jgi:hypothetical protein